jgi:GNAT superfamily N-acetyltransferase
VLQVPGVDIFLARREGEPVSALAVGRLGPVAGIYAVGTRPACRRQGASAATLAVSIAWCLGQGVSLCCLIAASAAVPLYASLGFTTLELHDAWLVRPARS